MLCIRYRAGLQSRRRENDQQHARHVGALLDALTTMAIIVEGSAYKAEIYRGSYKIYGFGRRRGVRPMI